MPLLSPLFMGEKSNSMVKAVILDLEFHEGQTLKP
jgi:hypothetical protein